MEMNELLEQAISYGEQGNTEKVLELADKVMETNATYYYYAFAKDVKGAPVDKIVEKIIEKKDGRMAALMVLNVRGVKVKGLLSIINEPSITLERLLNSDILDIDQKLDAIAFYAKSGDTFQLVTNWLNSFDLNKYLEKSEISKMKKLAILLKLGQIDPDAITTLGKIDRLSVISYWLVTERYDLVASIIDRSLMENRKTLKLYIDDCK